MIAWSSVRRVVYPGALLFSTCVAYGLLRAGASEMGAVAAAVLGTGAILFGLERARPHSVQWNPSRRTLVLDVTHTLVSAELVSPLVKAGLVLAIAELVRPHLGLALWPSDWPLALQVALAVVLGDLGIYLGHRVMHVTALGWRLHAVHHTPLGLNLWASARSHPLNVVVKITLETGVLLLFGISSDAFVLWLVFMTVNGLLQHSNIDIATGWLSHVLATPEVHRIHHSRDLALSNKNFGNTTVIWDRIFGSFVLPDVGAPTLDVGIAGCDVPERYVDHLLAPFVLGRYEAGATGGVAPAPERG